MCVSVLWIICIMSSANRDLVTMNRDFVRLKRDFRIQEIAPLLSLCFIIIVLTGLSAFIKKGMAHP